MTGQKNMKNAMRTKKIGPKTIILYIVTKNDTDNNNNDDNDNNENNNTDKNDNIRSVSKVIAESINVLTYVISFNTP
jgi:hypothetical protein